jgi:hypothetical protein
MAEAAVDWLTRRYPRIHDVMFGWEFRLGRNPSFRAVPVPGAFPPLHMIRTPRWGDLPQLTFYFRYDDDSVTVEAIRVVEPVSPSDL